MKIFSFLFYLFYFHFNKGKYRGDAYDSALVVFAGFIYLNVFFVFMILKLDWVILNLVHNKNRIYKYIIAAIVWYPFYKFTKSLLNEDVVKKMKYSRSQITYGNTFLILYFISVLIFFLMHVIDK